MCASDNKEFQSKHNNNKERLEAFTASYGDRKLVAQVFLLGRWTRKVKDFKAIVIKIDELWVPDDRSTVGTAFRSEGDYNVE